MRIGHGYDAHRFIEGKELVLGGVPIPYKYGLEAHSDGDVVLHALCDALLGAIAAGDIGTHFPDSEEEFSGIDSRILLTKVYKLVTDSSLAVGNLDITIIAQKPYLKPYIKQICDRISGDLCLSVGQVNVKATTTEKMGFIGREEGIVVHAVVLLMNITEGKAKNGTR